MTKPIAQDDYAKISVEDVDGKITGNLLANDSDPASDPLYLRFVDGIRVGDKGVDTIQGTYGTFTFKADGTFIYTLDTSNPAVQALQPGQTLSESLNYKVSDGHGQTDFGLFSLEITGPNLRPSAVDDHYALDLGGSTTFSSNVLANDTDANGDTLQTSFIGASSPLTYIPNDGSDVVFQGQYGTISIGRDGSFVYTADAAKVDAALATSDHVVEHFEYKIWDGEPIHSADQADIYIDLTHTI
ncbi:MAG: Ig-like domain-containing protein [Devosia sp.]|nr:Ig-like domain-containing protein [Devosia sp.]